MKKELIYLKTNSEGDISVKAYKFTEGLYIHKHYRGKGEFSDMNYWTITHKSGFCVKDFRYIPMRLKDVILEAEKLLCLNWNLSADLVTNPEYGKIVRELHG